MRPLHTSSAAEQHTDHESSVCTERSRDGLSGDNSYTSRTPVSGGRRAPQQAAGESVVVNVTKNVITMRDMGDDGSERHVKGEQWGAEMA